MTTPFDLGDKVAIVTGSSRGIGRALSAGGPGGNMDGLAPKGGDPVGTVLRQSLEGKLAPKRRRCCAAEQRDNSRRFTGQTSRASTERIAHLSDSRRLLRQIDLFGDYLT
jgi:hypothetical protein